MSTVAPAVPGYCVDVQCACHIGGLGAEPPLPWDSGVPAGCCHRCGRRGPQPLSIVPPSGAVDIADLVASIERTRQAHGDMLLDFHKVWYESGHTWVFTHFAGIGLMKNPNDLWAYQDLISTHRPKTIIETGTFAGGSALWFAFLMDLLRIDGGRIITIDLDDHRQCNHPRITFVGGDSTDPELAEAVLAEVQHPLMISLDADHSAAHVLKELNLYAPAVQPGEYLIVEDTNVGWAGEGGDRGARGGLEDYLLAHPGEFCQDIVPERYLLTMNPGGWLRRVAPCTHEDTE